MTRHIGLKGMAKAFHTSSCRRPGESARALPAVVRAKVRYGDPVRQEYRDLWVMQDK